jgi:HAD superfamily hydrolase (TIGR01509 family)
MNEFEAVFFDMDGVLLDSYLIHSRAYQHVFDRMGVSIDYCKIAGRSTTDVMLEVGTEHGLTRIEIDRLVFAKQSEARRLIEEFGEPPLFPGVRDCLASIAQAGAHISLCTSASKTTVKWFLSSLPHGVFNDVITSQDVKSSKPDPEIYLRAISAAAKDPSTCLVVEDSQSGVVAARRAGCHVATVAWGSAMTEDCRPRDLVIDSLVTFGQEFASCAIND